MATLDWTVRTRAVRGIRWRNRRKLREFKHRFDAFRIRRQGSFAVRKLTIDVTYKCNLTCVTCRATTNTGQAAYKNRPMLTLGEWESLFLEFKKFGGTAVDFSGGEPFLHPEIGSILEMAKNMELRVIVTSNHTVFNDNNVQYVADYVDQLNFSLDGPSAEVNDAIRGKGAFQKAIKGRRILQGALEERKKTGVAEFINCTISKYNYKSMPQMIELASELGIKHVCFNYVTLLPDEIDEETEKITGIKRYPENSHWNLDSSIRIPADQIEESCKSAEEAKVRAKELKVIVECDFVFDGKHNDSMLTGEFRLTKKSTCNVFWNQMGVLPDGSFYLCSMMQHYPIANFRESSLEDALGHADRRRAQNALDKKWLPICRYCCQHALCAV